MPERLRPRPALAAASRSAFLQVPQVPARGHCPQRRSLCRLLPWSLHNASAILHAALCAARRVEHKDLCAHGQQRAAPVFPLRASGARVWVACVLSPLSSSFCACTDARAELCADVSRPRSGPLRCCPAGVRKLSKSVEWACQISQSQARISGMLQRDTLGCTRPAGRPERQRVR